MIDVHQQEFPVIRKLRDYEYIVFQDENGDPVISAEQFYQYFPVERKIDKKSLNAFNILALAPEAEDERVGLDIMMLAEYLAIFFDMKEEQTVRELAWHTGQWVLAQSKQKAKERKRALRLAEKSSKS